MSQKLVSLLIIAVAINALLVSGDTDAKANNENVKKLKNPVKINPNVETAAKVKDAPQVQKAVEAEKVPKVEDDDADVMVVENEDDAVTFESEDKADLPLPAPLAADPLASFAALQSLFSQQQPLADAGVAAPADPLAGILGLLGNLQQQPAGAGVAAPADPLAGILGLLGNLPKQPSAGAGVAAPVDPLSGILGLLGNPSGASGGGAGQANPLSSLAQIGQFVNTLQELTKPDADPDHLVRVLTDLSAKFGAKDEL